MLQWISRSLFLVALMTAPAFASPIAPGIAHFVLDHPDGNLAAPYYALRLDGLDGKKKHDFTFSAEQGGAELTILYDEVADTVTLEGTVFGGRDVGDRYSHPQLWEITFVYSGVRDLGDRLETGPGAGIGKMRALGVGGRSAGGFDVGETFHLVDKANDEGWSFRLAFGHRAPDHVLAGWGWLTHDGIKKRTSSQDWLFTVGDPVPEPGTAALLGAGLVALAGVRRRQRA